LFRLSDIKTILKRLLSASKFSDLLLPAVLSATRHSAERPTV
jgi:hypothetical protein